MRTNSLLLSCLLATASLGVVSTASAQTAPAAQSYVVKAGDTCESLSQKFYGDPRLTDVIHKGNPNQFKSPPPHHLKPGTTLTIPAKPADRDAPPDAKLNFVRNQVQVQVPDVKDGKLNDPLFRGNRVNTLDSSSAAVIFQDESQIQLGEETLVIILGDAKEAAKKLPSETTLVTGNLVARMAAATDKAKPLPIVTESGAKLKMNSGEARVSLDKTDKATRVAVYRGDTDVEAKKKKVKVLDGFGSKVEKGKAPTPPKPLPATPAWDAAPPLFVMTDDAKKGTLRAVYKAGSAEPVTQWHVQLSKDEAFNDLVVDARIPTPTVELKAENLGPGAYYARVSAVDADKFEGKFTAFAPTTVATYKKVVDGDRLRVEFAPSNGVYCSVDGGAFALVTAPLMLGRQAAHLLRCAGTAEGSGSSEIAIEQDVKPEPKISPMVVTATWLSSDATTDSGEAQVSVLGAEGQPIPDAKLTVSQGVTLLDTKVASPGVYKAKVSWIDGTGSFAFHVQVSDKDKADSPALVLASHKDKIGLEIPISFGVGMVNTSLSQYGVRGRIGLSARIPVGPGALALGGLFGYEGYPSVEVDAVDPDGVRGSGRFSIRHTDVSFGLPIAYRLGKRDTRVTPYIGITPELLVQSAEVTRVTTTGTDKVVTASATILGIAPQVGVQFKMGPGAIFIEGAYRFSDTVSRDYASVRGRGLFFDVGYRIMP